MPKLTILCLIFTLFTGAVWANEEIVLVLDTLEDLAEFRSFADAEDLALKDLDASGSAQFTESGLAKLVEKFGGKSLMIVDLRRESHAFVDKLPVSWMLWDTNWSNIGLSIEQISEDEERHLNILRKEKNIVLQRITKVDGKKVRTPMSVTVTSAYSESNLAARDGVGYMRVPVSDHQAPLGPQINQLITLFKTKPVSGWIHFHCKGGKGRTALFLTMWDMLHNAKDDSFETIMKRQNDFSHYDMTAPGSSKRYPLEFAEKLKVLQAFYDYCKNNKDAFQTLYYQEPVAPKKE